jgi:hypothetical protein
MNISIFIKKINCNVKIKFIVLILMQITPKSKESFVKDFLKDVKPFKTNTDI